MEEKKSKKGCLIAVLIFLILFFAMIACGTLAVVVAFFSSGADSTDFQEKYARSGDSEKKVIVIDVKGEITNSSSSSGLFSSEIASAPLIIAEIKSAVNDPEVVGIVLDMDTPGGDVVASDLIYKELLEAKNSGLIVITSMQTLGASGGYYIAAASDKIFANEMTMTGSIGVYSVYQDVSGLYEKIGITQRVIKAGDYKTGEGLFDEDNNGEEDQIYQALVDEAYEQFRGIVSTERGIPLSQMNDIADGRVFTGSQALANGLIDQIGGIDDAIEQVENLSGHNNLSVVRYYSSDFFEEILSIFKDTNVEALLLNLAKQEEGTKIMYKMQ